MPKTITTFQIFLASPSDLVEERRLVEDVINELNQTWPKQRGILLQLITWETNTAPGIASDPQTVINRQIPNDYDILIAMFWTRFGTPTPRSLSGTAEEFEAAYNRWVENPQSIGIMVYFKIQSLSIDQIDADQLKHVQEFRKSLSDRGVNYRVFNNLTLEFSQK